MQVVITGGAGFVGARLARALLARGGLSVAGGVRQPITELVLVDRAAPPTDLAAQPQVRGVVGDLNALLAADQVVAAASAVVFHLAAAVSGECEADFDLGMRSNYAATHALLEACRRHGSRPTVFFSSSIAVFGTTRHHPFPLEIVDTTLPVPQTSYGIQKLIGEQLMADYTRKGFIRARSARLATVSVRAGRPNGAASGFFSGMIREPLAGIRCTIPVPADVVHTLSSPGKTVEHIMACVEASDEAWGPSTAINMPGIPMTVAGMADTLKRIGGEAAHELLDWQIDPTVERIVKGWPTRVVGVRAKALGMQANTSFDEIVREYVRENPDEVKLALPSK